MGLSLRSLSMVILGRDTTHLIKGLKEDSVVNYDADLEPVNMHGLDGGVAMTVTNTENEMEDSGSIVIKSGPFMIQDRIQIVAVCSCRQHLIVVDALDPNASVDRAQREMVNDIMSLPLDLTTGVDQTN